MTLAERIREGLAAPFEVELVLEACERVSDQLAVIQPDLARFLRRESLEERLDRELGVDPFHFSRPNHRRSVFERWCPLGLIAHRYPMGSPVAGMLSLVLGLLTGNVNALALDEPLPALFFKLLIAEDRSHMIAPRVLALTDEMLGLAQGVAVWGDDRPATTARLIEWRATSQVAYVASDSLAGLELIAARWPGRILAEIEDPGREVESVRREDIGRTLGPGPHTVRLVCGLASLADLCDALTRAGAEQILTVDDPVIPTVSLASYAHKTVVRALPSAVQGISTFADLTPAPPLEESSATVMTKEDFHASRVDPRYADLFFKSGGSCGEPKLSVFTYRDYHIQHRAQAAGLFAAGLEPERDRCMNLFVAGGLYGGFVSFFTVLESLNAVQFPMAAHPDLAMVAQTIVSHGCNVLLGMPTYLMALFSQNAELFRKHQVVKKLFFGGEPFYASQRRFLERELGIELIRSSGYGSVDAGPIGYQCPACTGGAYHLHHRLHRLEILASDSDSLANSGRVVLTSLVRSGQKLERYDVGDVARLVPEPCPCGRQSPRFELLGRHGDVFRVGGGQLNYRKLVEGLDHCGDVQVILQAGESREQLALLVTAGEPGRVRQGLLDGYPDLRDLVSRLGQLELSVARVGPEQLQRTAVGKLLHVVDRRG